MTKCLILLTNFVALLWTFSITVISFLYRGEHTVTAYYRWGRIIDLYKFRNISLSMLVKVLKMIPRFRLALLTFVEMCSLKFSAWSIITPRSFSLVTFSISITPCQESIVHVTESCQEPISWCLHFLKLNSISQMLYRVTASSTHRLRRYPCTLWHHQQRVS